ncbi:hypothetical protein K9O30_19870 [Clostridium bowmanii]|uniref:hypothetical protein n=1 Tax=Clostridium bowmanii TaxID=132925 RepID=UPI001CD1CBBB|nr:hypothetical protein [Clostridium bowmanii]MCA1075937.1 hypothetical protein [Clostridium bowmanii]
MNMRNNLTNYKILLFTMIYTVICIILIRHFTVLATITSINQEKMNSKIIFLRPINISAFSNELPYTSNLPINKQLTTLSRGYIGKVDNNAPKKKVSHNYDDEIYTLNESALLDSYYTRKSKINSSTIIPKVNKILNGHLPAFLMYKNVNITNLKEFLKSRNSLLVEDPYFSTIISVSKDFNLNPLVMFAITGQEQSFVSKDNKNAYKIANNPFNVFNSWQKYNTSIQDTTRIAARTIVNLCKNKPDDIDAFTWVNRKYSEDKSWSKSVRSIFKQLEGNVSYWK